MFNKFVEKAKDITQAATDSLINANGEWMPDFKTMGADRVRSFVEDFNETLPTLEKAGYELKALEVEMGLPPKFVPLFKLNKELTGEEKESLLAQVEGKRLVKLMLNTLFSASSFQRSLKIGRLESYGVEIELTAIPSVRLIFTEGDTLKIPVDI